MTESVTRAGIPSLWRLARLDHDRVRDRPILLYPEGVVFLNETGAAILELCDGRRTLGEIAGLLRDRYEAEVLDDVLAYVTDLTARELIDVR